MKPILSPTCLTCQIFSSYHLFDPLEMFHMIISRRMPVFITFHRSKSNMFAATKPTPSPIDPVKSPDLHRFFAEKTPKKTGRATNSSPPPPQLPPWARCMEWRPPARRSSDAQRLCCFTSDASSAVPPCLKCGALILGRVI